MEPRTVQIVNLGRRPKDAVPQAEPPAPHGDEPVKPDPVKALAMERNRAALLDVKLTRALFLYTCKNCGGNNPEIYRTDGETRYCKCRQCWQNDPGKIIVTAPTDEEVNQWTTEGKSRSR